MATKSYSKHKEFREYKSSGNSAPPYTDEQFDMLKNELVPAHSKLNSLPRNGGAREYHYEYKEEKHPSGKYDRKDLHTVEQYVIPPKTTPKGTESSSYYYEREERELPLATSGSRTYNYESSTSSTPGYSKVKSSKATKALSHNVDELDSLLDDLQRDQERQLYKSGYASDAAESTSFDYRKGTPGKTSAYSSLRREEYSTLPSQAPSSGYSTLQREETNYSSPAAARAELRREEMFREEKTESRIVPVPVPAITTSTVCTNCHQIPNSGTLPRGAPMNKVTTTVKTYTYEVPAGADPAAVPVPARPDSERVYVSQNLSSTTNAGPPGSPGAPGGCQHCSHCNSRLRNYSATHLTSTDEHTSERMVYPNPANETKIIHTTDTHNGHSPYGPPTYKYSETSYSAHNSTERYPAAPGPAPAGRQLTPSPAPFPRPATPSAGDQQPPKRLDDLLADFPEARFPTQPDGVSRRHVEVRREAPPAPAAPPAPHKSALRAGSSVAGPAVYYPPGHVPFEKKETAGYQASAMQGGGAHASGRGMYEYESGARSKEKHSERKAAVPVCLPLCCAMPCAIM